jgi:MarR family transcriptional regulator, lower aerobic nicotinate degradation pathway regulator
MTEPMPDALAERLGPLLGRAHDAHRRLSLQALAPLGLSVKAVGAMTVLEAEGPLSQRRLAERQGIDRTTMVAVVDELERLGAAERHRDPGDRRANALRLTASGRRLLARARTAVAVAEEAFLAPLSEAEQRRLRAALRLLVESGPQA